MWEKIKEIYHGAFYILALCWVLAHLIMILLWGTVLIYEPNPIILWVEIIVTSILIILGIERLIKDFRK